MKFPRIKIKNIKNLLKLVFEKVAANSLISTIFFIILASILSAFFFKKNIAVLQTPIKAPKSVELNLKEMEKVLNILKEREKKYEMKIEEISNPFSY